MQIYIAYQYAGKDRIKLKEKLMKISAIIEKKDHSTFVFSRDIQNWGDKNMDFKEIFPIAFKEISDSDLLLIFIDEYSASTGIGLEVGYAKGLGIPIVMAIKEDNSDNYLSGIYDVLIEYSNFSDLIERLEDFEF
jgi:nucleoside 2-deoxyribosyltransferase